LAFVRFILLVVFDILTSNVDNDSEHK
jgi:hypothetical protein